MDWPKLCFFSPRFFFTLVCVLSQRECIARHGLEVPGLGQVLLEGIMPVPLELSGNGPSHLGASKPHAHEMPLLLLDLAIGEALAAVKDSQVVDEVHVTGLSLDFKLSSLCNGLDEIQSLLLALIGLGQMLRSRVCSIAEKRCPTKIHDEARILLEDDRTTLEMRAVYYLVSRLFFNIMSDNP